MIRPITVRLMIAIDGSAKIATPLPVPSKDENSQSVFSYILDRTLSRKIAEGSVLVVPFSRDI